LTIRDPGLRHEIREVQGQDLLVEGENRGGAVEHDRPTAQSEHLRRDRVLPVDGGVLALEDHVDVVVERECPGRLQLGVTALLPTKCDLGHTTEGPAVVDGEVLLLEIEHPVAPALGLEHQQEGGVLLDVDGPDGVHHEGESERLAGGHFSDSADPPKR
jgi:hypothetical protein